MSIGTSAVTNSATTLAATGRAGVPISKVPCSSTLTVPTLMRVFASVLKVSVPSMLMHFNAASLTTSYVTVVAGAIRMASPAPGTRPDDHVAGFDQAPLATDVTPGAAQNCGMPRGMPLAGPWRCPWAHPTPGTSRSV